MESCTLQAPIHVSADAPDNRRFLAFDLMLDPHYEIPLGWEILMQAWQRCNTHPPFTIEVQPGRDRMGPVNLTFGVRDDAAELAPHHPRKILYAMRLQRGEWHNFVFALAPQSDTSPRQGSLARWLDGRQTFSYHGPWGYSPTQPPPAGKVCNDRIALELGEYRPRQTTTQTIYLQDLRYGRDPDTIRSDLGPNSN